jgi:hypothetical protein
VIANPFKRRKERCKHQRTPLDPAARIAYNETVLQGESLE